MTAQSVERLVEIVCRRNVGLRSLLYALLPAPMTIEEIGRQQLETHPELGWNPEKTDMAKQRANWLINSVHLRTPQRPRSTGLKKDWLWFLSS